MKKHILIVGLVLSLILSCTGCSVPTDQTVAHTDDTLSGELQTDAPTTTEAPATDSLETEEPTNAPTEAPTTEAAPTEAPTQPETPESSDAPPSLSFEDRNDTVYTTDYLNIRTAPSTDAEVIVVLAPSQALTRTGYHEEWTRLNYDGRTAYAASAYLSTEEPTMSNDSLVFGYDRTKRGENNIPSGMPWYVRNWGDHADFLQDTSKKIIYLTMDEGYENGYTPMILDVLKEKQVRCVFFLTKQFVVEQPGLVQRMIDEGHILGNHTCSHPANGMPSLSVEAQKDDIMTLHNMVLNQFGYDMKLFRFPAGIYSDQSLSVVSSLGYRSVFWSFAYRDFEVNNQPDPTYALNLCLDELHPGAIYLIHAVSRTNAHILSDFIDGARARGYEFGTYPVN